ncbi:hypothetical protein OBBRIDRAFT_491116 [Obba rivulosa]|uniref:Uncharacterized protein n=1 Tax=Obba rivulosa TaxID=1052685 RepID=A0A8E2DNW8_9APHY|nr:hypothetical protein OBBRIDRAFT_491116 [Obba rivulosa]
MAEHAGSSKSKDVSQHPPLITPSASPPSSRVSHVSRSRPPEGPPFAKRPRLVSTPSSLRSFSTPSSSATAVDPHNDFYEERRKSQKRLVDFWAQLEGRYSRPLDEDDIIDVVSESMVKDGGFLRGLRKQLDIGCFQAGSGAQDTGDASSEGGGPLTEPEEEVDEIDAFATPAPEANFSDEWEKAKNVPPVQVLDPADAQDLEAFMEAERRRKELYGDEEDFDVCDITLLAGPQVSPCQRSSRSSATPSQLFDDGALGNADEEPGDEKEEYPVYPITPKRIKPRRKSIAPFIDDASEDEFAAWTTSESTPARSTVRKARAQSKSRTQTASVPARDIIDLTGASSKSGTQSDLASHIPDEIPIELAHSSAVRMRSRAKSKPPARRTAAKSVSPRVSLALIQLHTPPQSTSPAHEHEHDTAAIHDAPPRCETSESIRSRRETFSFPSPPRPRRRLPRVVQDQSATTSDVLNSPILSTADDISFAHASASSPSKASRPAITKSIATSKIVPDAVITEKYTPITRSAARKLRPPAPGPPSHENEESPVAPPSTARFTRRDKGKGKAGVESPDVPDSPELTLAVAPTMRTRSKRSTSKPLLKETPVLSSSESPLAKPSRGRKRKRIVSTSSISEPEGHVGVSSSDAGHYGPSSPSEHRETLARIQFDSPSPPSRSHITGSLSRVRDEGCMLQTLSAASHFTH